MATPQFTSGANELIFTSGLVYPVRRPFQKIQITDRTAAGSLQVEDLGVEVRTLPLVFRNLSAALYAELATWYDTIADGAVNTFTYTDEDATEWTVRLLASPLDFSKTRSGRYAGELLLEVVS